MRQIFSKKNITFLIMFISFFSLAFYMNIYTRTLIDLNAYGFNGFHYDILWIGFSLSWIIGFLLILSFLKPKKRNITFFILNAIWIIIFFAQICYVQQLGKFMILSDLFLAGEGFHYIKSIFANMNLGMIITIIFSLICMIGIGIINKNNDEVYEKPKKLVVIFSLLLILLCRLGSFVSLGKLAETDSWQENYNVHNIYTNYTNPNTSMFVSGLYEYNIRAVYKYFQNLVSMNKEQLRKDIDKYNDKYHVDYEENGYTGMFKNKNVIFVMMESIDSWIVDKDTMPTLTNMMNTGFNFKNRYSPFFNGGQTINTEFALNTGMYAISSKSTIYDIDDVDYHYSLANMLKNNGYIVNSFHANTGSFYNRNEFHKLLGYDQHYSALDMQKAKKIDNTKNLFSDSAFISDKDLENLFLNDNQLFLSFFTTYSAHLEYVVNNKVYKTIKHPLKNKYTDEEYIYRTLARDTDEFLRILIDKLKEHNLLDNTVIVLVSDHYVYGYSDPDYVALKKGVMFDRKELQKTPFVIWSNNMDNKDVNIILDTADILPTLLNLLGIPYDPNKYMGTDVFSKYHDDFVWFSDGTFIKSKNCQLTDEEILTKTNLNIKKNRSILLTNYYGK